MKNFFFETQKRKKMRAWLWSRDTRKGEFVKKEKKVSNMVKYIQKDRERQRERESEGKQSEKRENRRENEERRLR